MDNKTKIYEKLLESGNKTWKEFGKELLSSIKGDLVIKELDDNYVKMIREPQEEFIIEISGDEISFNYESNTECGKEDITLLNCGLSNIPEKGIYAYIEKVSVCHAETYVDIKIYKDKKLISENTKYLERGDTTSPRSFLPEKVDSYVIIDRDEYSPA